MSDTGRNIGIMGGTFDPIHIGHLLLAEHAREQFHLDKVYIMPNGTPAYKSDHVVTGSPMRTEMAALAIAGNPGFELSLIEVEREGNTYTYETLEAMRNMNPADTYYFIIGADSLFTFSQWKKPQRIADNCILLIANRDNVSMEEIKAQIARLKERFGADIRILECPTVDISSAMIRGRVSEGKSIRYYVPDAVADYISDKGLYR